MIERQAKAKSGPGTIGHWFDQKWVDVSTKGKDGKHPPCGRKSAKKGKSKRGYPKCVPAGKAGKLSDKEKKKMTKTKRSTKPSKGKKPTYTSSKTKKQKKKSKKKSKKSSLLEMLMVKYAEEAIGLDEPFKDFEEEDDLISGEIRLDTPLPQGDPFEQFLIPEAVTSQRAKEIREILARPEMNKKLRKIVELVNKVAPEGAEYPGSADYGDVLDLIIRSNFPKEVKSELLKNLRRNSSSKINYLEEQGDTIERPLATTTFPQTRSEPTESLPMFNLKDLRAFDIRNGLSTSIDRVISASLLRNADIPFLERLMFKYAEEATDLDESFEDVESGRQTAGDMINEIGPAGLIQLNAIAELLDFLADNPHDEYAEPTRRQALQLINLAKFPAELENELKISLRFGMKPNPQYMKDSPDDDLEEDLISDEIRQDTPLPGTEYDYPTYRRHDDYVQFLMPESVPPERAEKIREILARPEMNKRLRNIVEVMNKIPPSDTVASGDILKAILKYNFPPEVESELSKNLRRSLDSKINYLKEQGDTIERPLATTTFPQTSGEPTESVPMFNLKDLKAFDRRINGISTSIDRVISASLLSDADIPFGIQIVGAYQMSDLFAKIAKKKKPKCKGTKSSPVGSPRQRAFCARMCKHRKKNTGSKTKKNPDSCINQALRRWKCRCAFEMFENIKTAARHRKDFLEVDYKIMHPNLNELEYDEAMDVHNAASFYVKTIRDKDVADAYKENKAVEDFLALLADYVSHSGSNTEIERMKAFSSQGANWPLLPEAFRDNWEIFQKALKARIRQAVDSLPEDEQMDIEVDIDDDDPSSVEPSTTRYERALPPASEEIQVDVVFDDEDEAPMSQRAPMTQRSILSFLNRMRVVIS